MEKRKRTRGSEGGGRASLSAGVIKRKLIAAVREVWRYYDPNRKASKEAAKVRSYGTNKDGSTSKKYTVSFRCAHCKGLFPTTDTDHIDPVGQEPGWPPDGSGEWDRYLLRMFTRLENHQELCKECHKLKTKKDNENERA